MEERLKHLEERVSSLEKALSLNPYPEKTTTFTTSTGTVTIYTQKQLSGEWWAWIEGGECVKGSNEGEVLQRVAEEIG